MKKKSPKSPENEPKRSREIVMEANKRQSEQTATVLSSEIDLLKAIYQGVPISIQQRYDELRECLHEETLTTEEHQELLQLVDVVEQCEVDRLEKLIQLAKLRNISLDELMQQLNLRIFSEIEEISGISCGGLVN